MVTIGKIERVPLREVWPHEAYDLTTWLEENVDVLNDALGLNLISAEREQSAGAFRVDLVAQDETGQAVVIENQLERSNHDHLGKLVTYTAMIDAQAAIWIVSDPRPEHVRAISWLNDSAPADFYLLKIEGIRIGDSLPAPLLTLIVEPGGEGQKEAGQKKKEIADDASARRRFWTGLLARASKRGGWHAAISPTERAWIGTNAGKPGLTFAYVLSQHSGRVELFIGGPSEETNLSIFNKLLAHKDEIETVYGGPLDWQPLEGRKRCRICERLEGIGYRDEDRWDELQERLIDAMIRLEKALRPYIAQLAN
jgi:hypothetical protein